MRKRREIDWSGIVAKQNVKWEDGPAKGGVVLLVPRFRRGPLAKWVQPRLKKPFIRLSLDEIGTFVWKEIDGVRTFETILESMKAHFGPKIEPSSERLQKFYSILHRNKFVELFEPSAPKT